jgi:hypothetical protein
LLDLPRCFLLPLHPLVLFFYSWFFPFSYAYSDHQAEAVFIFLVFPIFYPLHACLSVAGNFCIFLVELLINAG